MINNLHIESSLMPTDVKIYTEDGIPYLDYTGTCYMSDGCKYKIHFPKIGLTFFATYTRTRSGICLFRWL